MALVHCLQSAILHQGKSGARMSADTWSRWRRLVYCDLARQSGYGPAGGTAWKPPLRRLRQPSTDSKWHRRRPPEIHSTFLRPARANETCRFSHCDKPRCRYPPQEQQVAMDDRRGRQRAPRSTRNTSFACPGRVVSGRTATVCRAMPCQPPRRQFLCRQSHHPPPATSN